MQNTKRRDTPAELALRSLLHRLGLRFRVEYPLPGLRRRADVAFPRRKIAVFVDGCFWHGCPEHATWPRANAEWWRAKIEGNVARDRDTDARLLDAGWRVVRIWEHEAPPDGASRVVAAIRETDTEPAPAGARRTKRTQRRDARLVREGRAVP
jgi:DNA mismatch endonuclease, patch repair protein